MTADPKLAFVAPVMRHLAATDVARSVAFYRDVLGFEVRAVREDESLVRAARVESGPAAIQFDRVDPPSLDTSSLDPAIVFFEVADVAAIRDAIAARGGSPSALQRVNWIKTEMFEIRDPDGHTLWFGRSFGGPDIPVPQPMLQQALPEFPVNDVAAAIAHYRDVFGFRINHAEVDLGVMDRDAITLVLIARTPRHTGIGSAYFYIEDADALHAELSAKGANVLGLPVSQPWGLRDFGVLDPDGNQLRFGQRFE